MCTKTRRTRSANADKTSNDATSSNSNNANDNNNSALHSFLHDLISEKRRQSEGNQLQIQILPDDAAGCEGGLLRRGNSSRIGRCKSDPLHSMQRRSVLDVSDHSRGASRWLPMPQSPSKQKQMLSTYMVRQPMRSPSIQNVSVAKSA